MKFDVVVGNPPYQEHTVNTSDAQLYPYFFDLAERISDCVCLVTPGRFLMNAGKTAKSWNSKMLTDVHLKVLYYTRRSEDVFSNTSVAGGIAISYWNKYELFDPILFFYPYLEMKSIVDKVSLRSKVSLQSIFYPQTKWDFDSILNNNQSQIIEAVGNEKRLTSSIFDDLSDLNIFNDDAVTVNDTLIYGKAKSKKYIESNLLCHDESISNISSYKCIISAADGASGNIGDIAARIIGSPFIGGPNSGYTQTFISFGSFDNEVESNNLFKYMHSKFLRFMVGTLKATNSTKFSVWANVPLQDFTPDSDIDWTKSIAEIDQQLYTKYDLSDDEIMFIEEKVKPMA